MSVRDDLTTRLRAIQSDWGAPVFVRIYKQERELEVWARSGTTHCPSEWKVITDIAPTGTATQSGL